MDATKLSVELLKFETITPEDNGIMLYIEDILKKSGFTCNIKKFTDANQSAKDTLNLYASKNPDASKRLCFAGHVDVVHPGKENMWLYPPFLPTIDNGTLYARGACDMKCAVACFIVAATEFVKENPTLDGDISFLITGDEEGNAINGTPKMLTYLQENEIKISDCIIGEPTSSKILGDTIKIGRRGSVNFELELKGVQGHVAYPDLANNPLSTMAETIINLKSYKFDNGNEFFQPSNLEITTIDTENYSTNVIPASTKCGFNIRFNNCHTSSQVIKKVTSIIEETLAKNGKITYHLSYKVSGESFIYENSNISKILADSIKETTGTTAEFSTSGGTSDARFICNHCNVAELGFLNETAHKVNEHVAIEDIDNLYKIYKHAIRRYFNI